jgi:hypothetical protein
MKNADLKINLKYHNFQLTFQSHHICSFMNDIELKIKEEQ